MSKPAATARQATARAEPAVPNVLSPWASACATWDRAARDGPGLWLAGWRAWSDYFADLGRAMGPAALFDAQMRRFAEGSELCRHATAGRLRRAGVTAPLLSDT